ncbi:MAG TPA: hypothetical protein VE990_15540 [Acidimicrobiales bacterium]|nr:hypothetical protein [Acidimicrobiales bacterium]
MFLGSYDFDGDPETLLEAYNRLAAGFPPGALQLHVCVTREGGLTVFDGCPSKEVFLQFSAGEMFAAAVAAAGLPTPRVTPLGEVKNAVMRSTDPESKDR